MSVCAKNSWSLLRASSLRAFNEVDDLEHRCYGVKEIVDLSLVGALERNMLAI